LLIFLLDFYMTMDQESPRSLNLGCGSSVVGPGFHPARGEVIQKLNSYEAINPPQTTGLRWNPLNPRGHSAGLEFP
jgi:hypothetical protein